MPFRRTAHYRGLIILMLFGASVCALPAMAAEADVAPVRLTGTMVFIGFFQLVAFIALFVAFLKQSGAMRDAVSEMRKGTLATQDAVRLAREEFIALNRPELRVRHVHLGGKGKTPNISFSVVNTGTSRAIIHSSAAVAGYFGDNDLPAPHDIEATNAVTRKIFHPGNSDGYTVEYDTAGKGAGKALTVAGWIIYKDGLGNMRKTHFCRRESPQGFIPAGNPDYEAID